MIINWQVDIGTVAQIIVFLVGGAGVFFKLRGDVNETKQAIIEIRETVKKVYEHETRVAVLAQRVTNIEQRQFERLRQQRKTTE